MCKILYTVCKFVCTSYGLTKLETPVPVRILKLSNLGHGWVTFQGLDVDAVAPNTEKFRKRRNGASIKYCTSGTNKKMVCTFGDYTACKQLWIKGFHMWPAGSGMSIDLVDMVVFCNGSLSVQSVPCINWFLSLAQCVQTSEPSVWSYRLHSTLLHWASRAMAQSC